METETTPACANPGCDQSGSKKCAACNTTPYCGPICQTDHWPHHREECEGHLLKVGSAHLAKAKDFYSANNLAQALRYSDLALAKLNAMKKRPLESVSEALACKCDSLNFLGRYAEFLQCAKDKYNMWALARGPAHPSTIDAAFLLIDGLLFNNENEDAHTYAHALWEIIHTNNHVDNDIPGDKRQEYVAKAAHILAHAIYRLAATGGIPPEEKQKSGEEAIARARQAVEIRTQLSGAESSEHAAAMVNLAGVLDFFVDYSDNSEVPCLYEQAIAIYTRVYGRTSMDVGASEFNLAHTYYQRAEIAHADRDLDRKQANLELALPHYREAARIYTTLSPNIGYADSALRKVAYIEEDLRRIGVARALVEAARARGRGVS